MFPNLILLRRCEAGRTFNGNFVFLRTNGDRLHTSAIKLKLKQIIGCLWLSALMLNTVDRTPTTGQPH